MKWSQKAREYHLEAGDRGKGEGVEGMGLARMLIKSHTGLREYITHANEQSQR